MSDPLEKDFEYYLEHQDELVRKYNGRYVVIQNQEVLDAYDDIETAVNETAKNHELGTFLVQRCSPGKEDYTQTFHSRVG